MSMADPQSVAITGLSCRFPGEADSVENFWEFICKGRSAYSENPERLNLDAFHHPVKKLNTSISKGAHFLKQDVAAFDTNLFTISKTEAESIDPQQRILMEVAFEAMESAGISIQSIAGTRTGVFVGSFTSDYRESLFRDPESAPMYTATGTTNASASNRISWFFDLKGPSFTLNTACSSSLVALHLACQSLRAGESDIAIVGGTSLLLNPDMFMYLSNQQFLAKDGRCKSFDESGDGYGRGDGIAAVVLKRIDDAITHNDPIRAVIRGTGCNQDGKTQGFTLPSADAQVDLIRETYLSAGLDLKDTHYVEAHGTGTRAGDSQETEALSRTFGAVHSSSNKLLVGSVKSSIGHLEACAGLAALIKGVCMLEHGMIPPTIHYRSPNPQIQFEKWNLDVPTKLTPWPVTGLRRLSANSFGYGGSNAHAVLDDAYHYLKERNIQGVHHTQVSDLPTPSNVLTNGLNAWNGIHTKSEQRLFVLTAADKGGLKRLKISLSGFLKDKSSKLAAANQSSQEYIRDLAYTLADRRSRLQWNTYAVAASLAQLCHALEDDSSDASVSRSAREPRLGFMFTGQGAQWAKMGEELMDYRPFRDSVRAADNFLRSELGVAWSVVEELVRDEDSNLHLAEYSQTICTVLQVALVDLLDSWNITPSAIVGHSSGEISGAYSLGALSREDAWTIAYYRGLLSSQLKSLSPTSEGAMMAVGATPKEAEAWISKVTKGEIVIACINSPSSVTISGDAAGIDQLFGMLNTEGIFARKLKVDTAYHSPHMNAIAGLYLEAIAHVCPTMPLEERTMYSSVAPGPVDFSELGPANWVRNLLSPVRFSDAVYDMVRPYRNGKRVSENAVDILLEVGPHSALKGPAGQTMKAHGIKGVPYSSVLSRGCNSVESALACAGDLFTQGVPVDIGEVNRLSIGSSKSLPRPLVDLPAYPWNRSLTFWSESRISKLHRLRKQAPRKFLGAPCSPMRERERFWRGYIRLSEEPWIRDHKIQGSVLYPGAGFLAMAVEAACEMADAGRVVRAFRLRDVQISAPVIMMDDVGVECTVELRPHVMGTRDDTASWWEFTIATSVDHQDPSQNCTGLITIDYQAKKDSDMMSERDLEAKAVRDGFLAADSLCSSVITPAKFYEDLANLGLTYGATFRNVAQIRQRDGQSLCSIGIPQDPTEHDGRDIRPYIIHPATMDSIFHLAFAAAKGQTESTMVPKSIDEVVVSADISHKPGTALHGYSTAAKHGFREFLADISMLDSEMAKPVVTVKGFHCTGISGSSNDGDSTGAAAPKKLCSKLAWQPVRFDDFDASHSSVISPGALPSLDKTDNVVLVEAINPSTSALALATHLVSKLENLNIKVHRFRWNSDVTELIGKPCIVLMETDMPFFEGLSEQDFYSVRKLVFDAASLLWISSLDSPSGSLVTGLARSVRNEVPSLQFRTLQIDRESFRSPNNIASLVTKMSQFSATDNEFRIVDGLPMVSRVEEDTTLNEEIYRRLPQTAKQVDNIPLRQASGPQKVAVRNPGMLDSLCLEPDDVPLADLGEEEIEIQVKASGLNFRDVMGAMGQIPDDLLGFDASGVVRKVGKAVSKFNVGDSVSLYGHGALRTVHRSRADYCEIIPNGISFEEAATLPLVHGTAYYGLVKVARVSRGQRILIHAAAGGVGQAAIQLATHFGMEIFATVGSDEKRRLIREAYGVPDDHIFNSRDLSFAKGVKRMTNGHGVDVVLNSLSGEALRQTWYCLAPFGTFLEIGMRDILNNTRLDMRPFAQDAVFAFFNLNHIEKDNPKLMADIIEGTFDYLRRGITRPIFPLTTYPISEIETAFRSMQMGKHLGKIALTYGADNVLPIVRQPENTFKLQEDATYLLVGGLGGIGRSIAMLLVDHGARNLCFISRSGAKSDEARQLVKTLEERNVRIKIYRHDVANGKAITRSIAECARDLPQIRGVIQCAMVLRDSLFQNMDFSDWIECTRPKVQGSWNLHENLPEVDFFIILSSFSGIFGSRGQSNYAAAGAYEDALAHYRRANGQKAVTLDLGIMRDIGVLAEKGITDNLREWEEPFGIREQEFHALMEQTIGDQLSDSNQMPPQVVTGFATGGGAKAAGISRPFYFDDPRFSVLAEAGMEEHQSSEKVASLEDEVANSESLADAAASVADALVTRVAKSMQTSSSEIDVQRPLHSYGIDSLGAVDIVNWAFRDVRSNVTVFDILSAIPIIALAKNIALKSSVLPKTLLRD